MSAPSRDLEELLLCDGFVRAIARELAPDRQHAEDVAQELWVAALERSPLPGIPLAAWIKAVVRNMSSTVRRTDARRIERERDTARPEAVPSSAEILEREDARRRVVESVLALEEPYRSTMLLRYFDNLPPRAIAKRLGVPVETVRTRTKRGLDQLRARLDREYGGSRGAWCAVLAPMAHLPPAVPVAAGVGPAAAAATKLAAWKGLVVAMSTQAKLGVTALALVALSLAIFITFRREDPHSALPSRETEGVLANAAQETPSTSLAEPLPPLEAPARKAIAAIDPVEEKEAGPEFGSLLVHLVWADDRQPASGVGARMYFWGEVNPRFSALMRKSGPDGSIRVERVRPQKVGIYLDRGGVASAKVQAGATCEITVEVPSGFDVQGEVVDEAGAPVAGAEIWLCNIGSAAEGFAATRSSERGEFRVRSVSSGHCVGARAPGHAPSVLQHLIAGPGEKRNVRLALRGAGGAVAGRVLDPDGNPIGGATVIVGDTGTEGQRALLDDGSWGWVLGTAVAHTDERGAFRCEGIAPGETQVSARAHGFARNSGSVLVLEHRVTVFETQLGRGVRIAGTVTDPAGRPASRVEVRVGNYGMLDTSAVTALDGSYVLGHLTPGEILVQAGERENGEAQATFHASSGSELTWNPRLELGLRIFGRVVDEAGRPCAGWMVAMEDEPGGPAEGFDYGNTTTDDEGRFAFANCHDRGHRLSAQEPKIGRFPSAVLRNVRPGADEVVLLVLEANRPSVRIVGTLVDADGKPTAAAAISPWCAAWQTSPVESPEAGTGRFDLGPYPPGEWTLSVRAANYPPLRLGPKLLAAGETWDVGTVQLEVGGQLTVHLRREEGVPAKNPALSVIRQGRWTGAQFRFEGDNAFADPLAPGEYLLLISGEGVASTSMPVEIVSNLEKRLDVTLRPGVGCSLRVDLAEADETLRRVHGLIRDADGAFVHQLALWRKDDGPFETSLFLAPGDYRVEVTADGGRKSAGDLHVGELGSAGEKIVLTLR